MAGRPRVFDEDEILNKAIDMFWERGYEATTTEELLGCMKINKGSLYHAFGSKRDLFITAMTRFAKHSAHVTDMQISQAESPLAGIRSFFLGLAETDIQVHIKGCFMGNTIAETASVDQELKEMAAANLKGLEDVFHKHLVVARKSNELTTKEDPRLLARYLVSLWNGLNITRRMYTQKEILEPLIKLQLSPIK